MLSRSETRKEIEIATNKITTMLLNFGKSQSRCSYNHGSYKKKKFIESELYNRSERQSQ